jgi:hypothetical protein
MKTYVLLFSPKFSKGHPRHGKLTMFVSSIRSGGKLHTVRNDFDYWRPRIEAVQRGEGILSCRYWSGKAYASNQIEFAQLTAADGVGIERLTDHPGYATINAPDAQETGKNVFIDDVADNDGLNLCDFMAWFPTWGKAPEERALIHLTKFRYMGQQEVQAAV